MKIDAIKLNNANPRQIKDASFKKLCKSVKEFPKMLALRPIVVDRDGTILGGNMRYRALLSLGYKDIPDEWVRYADTLTDEEKRRFIIEDNVEFGEWDIEALANEWDTGELEDWGVEVTDLERSALQEAVEDDFNEEEVTESVCRKGDVWQLGDHRLMCGDSTSAEDVAKLMNGERCDIAFFSPPYNAGFGANLTKDNGRESKYIDFNDNKPQDEYCEFLRSAIDNAMTHSQYVFCNIQMLSNNKRALIDLMKNNINRLGDIIIWDKGHAQPQLAERVLNSVFEFVLVFHEKGTRAIGTKNFHGTLDNIVHIKPTRNEYSKEHNAVFPVELAAHFVSNFSTESVLDLFGGSGTTIVAAEQLGRKCRMMELDPHYCDVIIARWEKLTEKKAVKISKP